MDTNPNDLAAAGAEKRGRAAQSAHWSHLVPFNSPSPVNQQLRIFNNGTPGPRGALSHYDIIRPDDSKVVTVSFQNGTVPEVGINGVTVEALIAVCIDQLQQFQAGPFSSRENALAITKLEEGLMWLEKRTRDRQARGVEGTYQK